MEQQKVEFARKSLTFKTGTGKDAKIFIKFLIEENGEKKIYNIPLLTINNFQVFSSRPKVPRYTFGSEKPIGLSRGIRVVNGHITATTLNETIGATLRRELSNYKPIKASDLELDNEGVITLESLDKIQYLDELPLCQINIFIQNPETKKVFSKSVYGVSFTSESHSVGTSPTMSEAYSFSADGISALNYEKISIGVSK